MKRQQNSVHRVSLILPEYGCVLSFCFEGRNWTFPAQVKIRYSFHYIVKIFPGISSMFIRFFVNIRLNRPSLELYSLKKFSNFDSKPFLLKHLVLIPSILNGHITT